MLNEFDVIRDVTAKFDKAGIPYMLTGSLAMNYYSQPRMSRDIDFVVELSPKHVDLVFTLFKNDYYVDTGAISRAIAYEKLFNMIHNEAFIKVDCIIRKATDYRRTEFERRHEVIFQGVPVWLVSKEDLIISKLYWARDSHSELQLRDVKNLLSSGYDAAYLKHWAQNLDLTALLKECLNE